MTMLIRLLSIVVVIISATLYVAAQPRPLSLDSAIKIADEQSLDIQRGRLGVERADQGVVSTQDLYLPEVSATGDYNFYLQRPVLFVAPGNPFNETGSTEAYVIGGRHATGFGVNIRQPLYDPLRRIQRRVAESRVSLAQAELETIRATIRMQVERTYYRALYTRNERDARDRQIKQALANLDFTLTRFKLGRAMPLDTITASATLARARANAQRSIYNHQQDLLALARLLGLRDYQNLEVVGDLEIPETPGPSGGDMNVTVAGINSAEIRLAETRRTVAQIDLEAESRITWPTLDAIGRWQALGQSPSVLPDDWRWAMTSQIGLSAVYPISELWRGDARREAAEIHVRETELEIERLRREDSISVQVLLLKMQGARAQLVAEEASVEQAKKQIEISTILYKEGRATWLEVETAQSRLLDAELAEERMKLEFLDGYAELKAVLGSEELR